MCDYTSVWEVILRNADFTNVKPMNNSYEVLPETKFEIEAAILLICCLLLEF